MQRKKFYQIMPYVKNVLEVSKIELNLNAIKKQRSMITKKSILLIAGLGIFLFLMLQSCKSNAAFYNKQKIITGSCELNNKINDTVIIKGIYSECVEYSSFRAIKKDSCTKHFSMSLNFDQIELPKRFYKTLSKLEFCNQTIEMTLQGILKNNDPNGYGHLGTNNAELIVLKILDYGKIKIQEPKTPR